MAVDADTPTECLPGALAVDARGLHASGIGRYLRELLAQWLVEPPFETLRLLGERAAIRAFLAERRPVPAIEVVSFGGDFYSARSQLDWLRGARRSVVDARATFFPHWDVPLVAFPAHAVMTVHDLIPFRVPETTSAVRRALGGIALRRGLGAAARVLCVSNAAAADLLASYPAAGGKIAVVRNGATRLPSAVRRPLPGGVTSPFALVVGNRKPHKNVGVAIEAVARARALGHTSLTLVIVGRRFDDRAIPRATGSSERPFVVELGEVDDGVLAALYAGADALLFPSRYEGFGLPVLEAMAAGTPVVASAIPAVVEVAGDAVSLVPPNDAAAMAEALIALLRSPELRRTMSARGARRAREFSWRRAARETARVLHSTAHDGAATPAVRDVAPRR